MLKMSEAKERDAGRAGFNALERGRKLIAAEGRALLSLADRLGDEFTEAVDLIDASTGRVGVTGMGKSGLVGAKIAATLTSVGAPSYTLHPADALHGDLGNVRPGDVVIILSRSGETEEVLRLLPWLTRRSAAAVAITCGKDSQLAQRAAIAIDLGCIREAGHLGLAPTTSAAAMAAVGDALALSLCEKRQLGREQFFRLHPGGRVGEDLACVDRFMRPLDRCRVASRSSCVRQVLAEAASEARRCGDVVLVVGETGALSGLFHLSRLAGTLAQGHDGVLDGPVGQVMDPAAHCLSSGASLAKAKDLLSRTDAEELPVVDARGKPIGVFAKEQLQTEDTEI